MKAEDLMQPHPTVTMNAPLSVVADALIDSDLRAVLVVDDEGRLRGVITDAMLLRFLLPPYVREAESLAGVLQEHAADAVWKRLQGRTASEVVPEDLEVLPQVDAGATVVEVASTMVSTGAPVVGVLVEDRIAGAVRLRVLLDRLLRS